MEVLGVMMAKRSAVRPGRLFVFLLMGTSVISPASAGTVKGDLERKVDEYLSRLEPFGFSGGVLVAKDGEIVLEKGYG